MQCTNHVLLKALSAEKVHTRINQSTEAAWLSLSIPNRMDSSDVGVLGLMPNSSTLRSRFCNAIPRCLMPSVSGTEDVDISASASATAAHVASYTSTCPCRACEERCQRLLFLSRAELRISGVLLLASAQNRILQARTRLTVSMTRTCSMRCL